MRLKSPSILILALALCLTPVPLPAQEANSPEQEETALDAPQRGVYPADSVTEHTLGEGESALAYKATAGTLPMTNDKGETIARVYYTAYTAGEPDRPVSFVFNGGPGAASAFLHLSAIGPRVLDYEADGVTPVKPMALADNPDSWLPFTDLVFVDPVGTGFSRASEGEDAAEKAFYGVSRDASAMAKFVKLYLARNGRDLSPLYMVGESYGGFRAILLTENLLEDGFRVEGTVLISPALEFSMIRGDSYALVPLALDLAPIAASYLERTQGFDAPLKPVEEAEAFALSDYLLQLVRGLDADATSIATLSRLTGIEPEVIAEHHGRVSVQLFLQEYTRKTNRTLSRYDGAVSMPLPRPSRFSRVDPVLDRAVTVLTPLMKKYAREELKFRTDLGYILLNRGLNRRWDYGTTPNRQGFAGSLDELQNARTLNPDLKVFIAHGYTDLVTTYSASRFLVDQLEPIDEARPIEMRVYRGGHMMYMRPESRQALTADASRFYAE